MISDITKQRIKDANDIVDVVGSHLSLRQAGANQIGLCPFHDDKRPSFTVSRSKQIYHCFVCGAHGDVFKFIQETEQVSFPEAVKILGRKAGIEVEDRELTPEENAHIKERESLQIAIEAAAAFYEKNLPEATEALKQRGYTPTDKVVKDFRIGYAPEGNRLTSTLTASGFKVENLIKVDVVKQGEKGNYDTFRDRIQFPFFDLNGRVVGFSGRIVTPKDNAGKYVNTAETPLYIKGHNVFGLYQARTDIARTGNAYLVEGQFDVTSWHREGIRNTIGGSGTALTPEQVKLIGRFTRTVTLVYDADKAGITAAQRNCEALLHAGITVRCISLPDGKDPDNMANELKDELGKWLTQHSVSFVAYFFATLNTKPNDPESVTFAYNTIAKLVAAVQDDKLQSEYIRSMCELFGMADETQKAVSKIREIRSSNSIYKKTDAMKPGVYGLEELKEGLKLRFSEYEPIMVTSDFDEFLLSYTDRPYIYIHRRAKTSEIQELRSTITTVFVNARHLELNKSKEGEFLSSIVELYKYGLTDIRVVVEIKQKDENDEEYTEEEERPFLNYYFQIYSEASRQDSINKAIYVDRCADLLSYASESERFVNISDFAKGLDLPKSSFEAILKPILERKKSRLKIELQRDDSTLEEIDGSKVPDYVEKNEKYSKMYRNHQYFPYLNKQGEPVAYVFKEKNGHVIVGDFYLEPLLHVYHSDPEQNKRIFKVYRRYIAKPFYMEFKSQSLLMRTTFEAVIINEEAMNFENGQNEHWNKIRSCMSYNYTKVTEIKVYGQQHEDFFAFANAIFHKVNGRYQVDQTTNLGVTSHGDENYYHPAFSEINRNANEDDDPYEVIRQLKFDGTKADDDDDIVVAYSGDNNEQHRRDQFKKWAALMDQVYTINNNGKWALIYAIMCAFRSDIHSIDRFFTSVFFMGPTMSGKTQVAISIRSLFISPKQPAFNLCTGTDAAMATIMGNFRDVPVVLEEYNNKDISDVKFQALKAITYDGDSKQKRKGTSSKDIEMDKIFAPVVLCGQETPQRDDNALMNRIVVCEVPKKGLFTEEAKTIFQELKQMEKDGLSDVLFEVLQLRPLIRKFFKPYLRDISKQLSDKVLIGSNSSGDMVRIINTVSLFLTICRVITEHADYLELPFTYDEFFELAAAKVLSQVELITHTDKVANFFKAMDVMIDTGVVKRGRDFNIESPDQVTFKLPGNVKDVRIFQGQKKLLFLRISNLYVCYARNHNTENVSQSTLEQNLRSHPAYLGMMDGHRFRWNETIEVPAGESIKTVDGVEVKSQDMSMRKIIEQQVKITSCMVLDYEVFTHFYEDVDLERKRDTDEPTKSGSKDNPEEQDIMPF